ncbi:MAG: glycosyltransferase family 2 protein [Deltaproteobacteria bacterium]|nr:glycosyltransferase family 2 protein [Nannocystaceae bacterium]
MAATVTTIGAPELSIVIPVFNEREILAASIEELCTALRARGWSFEVVLAENGSTDGTLALAEALHERWPELSSFSHPEPNYGGALRQAIFRARGRYVICEEIDLCDVDFHARALELLRQGTADMVVGSKAMRGANDTRPLGRRLATRVYNGALRLAVGFRGTDTHGLKAFVRERVTPIAAACVVEHDVFASELVVRAHRAGLRVLEIPVEIHEKRAPSIRLVRRVPKVLHHLVRLMIAIHGGGARRDPP